MRAIVLEQYGGPEVLVVKELPDPVPGPEEVLVEVASSALNRADLAQRQGTYPSPPTPGGLGAHEIPGLEFAGRVAALGDRVRSWKVGDPVMAVTGVAGFAERTVAHERMLLPVPAAVDPADAAAIPEAWITAWDTLVAQGGLAAGGIALVHAGGSGISTPPSRSPAPSAPGWSSPARPARWSGAGTSAPPRRSTTAATTSWSPAPRSVTATGSTSCWTWSVGSTPSATSTRWRCGAGWCRSARWGRARSLNCC